MKKVNKSLVALMAFAVVSFLFTACSNSSSTGEETSEEVEVMVEETAEDAEGVTDEEASTEEVKFAWSSEFDDWVLNGTESKTITLTDLGDEESGISEIGQAQLDYIATVLETNDGINALIKGHTDLDQKVGNGRGRAMWTKAKLIIGHDAVGNRISTEGVGTDEPLAGVDLADDAQKTVTVTFTK